MFLQELRKALFKGYGETQISTAWIQSGEPKVILFSGKTSEISRKCIRSGRPSPHLAIHVSPDASAIDEINEPGSLGEQHVWKDVTRFGRELELNGLQAPAEIQINSVKQCVTKSNPEKNQNDVPLR